MKRKPRLFLVVVFCLVFCNYLPATRINPMTLETQIMKADLVALVQVTVSSGFYSQCRVIEAVKGNPKPEFILYTPPGPHGPLFPCDFVGEWMMVYAYKNKTPGNIISTSSAGPNVLVNRKMPFDYKLPLWQGKYEYESEEQGREKLEYARTFLAKSERERKAFFLRDLVGERYGAMEERGPVACSQRVRVVAFSNDEKRVMKTFAKLTRGELRWYFPYYRLLEEELTFKAVKKIRAEALDNKPPTALDLFSIEQDTEKTFVQWAEVKKKLPGDDNSRLEAYAEKLAKLEKPVEEDPYDKYRAMMMNKPAPDEVKQLEQAIPKASNEELLDIVEIFAFWRLPLTDALLADVSLRLIKDRIDKNNGSLHWAAEPLLSFPLPKNKEALLVILKKAKTTYDAGVILSLQAFYGDLAARSAMEKRLMAVSIYDDNGYNDDKTVVSSSDIECAHMVLYRYNKSLLIEIAKKNSFIRPKILKYLFNRGTQEIIAEANPLITALTTEQKQEFFGTIPLGRHQELFMAHYLKMLPTERLEFVLSVFSDLHRNQPPSSWEKWYKDEAVNLVSEALRKQQGGDPQTIVWGLGGLAVEAHDDFGKLMLLHNKALVPNSEMDDYRYDLVSIWAHNLKDKNRLHNLLSAKDPELLVPALIYLMIVDEERYFPQLAKLVDGDTLISARAALALAERGRVEKLDYLLDALVKQFEKNNEMERDWWHVRTRINLLFSNSTQGATNKMNLKQLRDYWKKHKGEIKIRDPWRDQWDKCFCE